MILFCPTAIGSLVDDNARGSVPCFTQIYNYIWIKHGADLFVTPLRSMFLHVMRTREESAEDRAQDLLTSISGKEHEGHREHRHADQTARQEVDQEEFCVALAITR